MGNFQLINIGLAVSSSVLMFINKDWGKWALILLVAYNTYMGVLK